MLQSQIVDLLLRGAACGGFVAAALALLCGWRLTPARWIGALFFATAIGHTLDNSLVFRALLPALVGPAHLLSSCGSGMFWGFVLALFDDDARPAWRRLWPTAVLLAIALIGPHLPPILHKGAVMGMAALAIVLVAHALLTIWRGWRGDLVDQRRRLRAPVMAAAAAYVLLISLGDLTQPFGFCMLPGSLTQAWILFVLSALGGLALLRLDPALVDGRPAPVAGPVPVEPPSPQPLDPGDRVILERLRRAMDEEEVWRRETLTVGALAALVDTPEHRLRRLINGRLGHRNFAAFVNARRIAAAKAELCDPALFRKPVSSIAYDLGFGSLGPFNRAFKDATGMTPSAWRQAQGGAPASPIPQTAA